MPCIFGFGFHEWFRPIAKHIRKPDIVICNQCKLKLEREYENLARESVWNYTFEDLLNLHIEERLKNLYNICWELDELDIIDKFSILYNNFMNSRAKKDRSKRNSIKYLVLLFYTPRSQKNPYCGTLSLLSTLYASKYRIGCQQSHAIPSYY
jgi:hypothetical protein